MPRSWRRSKPANKYVVNIRLIPDLFQLLTLKANIQDLDGFPVISIDDVLFEGHQKRSQKGRGPGRL